MRDLEISANDLAELMTDLAETEPVFLLDSCGGDHPDARHLFAGIRPTEIKEITDEPNVVLTEIDDLLTGDRPVIFTLSYEFGEKMLGMPREDSSGEPDLFAAVFNSLFIADYRTGRASVIGEPIDIDNLVVDRTDPSVNDRPDPIFHSNITAAEHHKAVLEIHERIRDGITYQTNLTRQLVAENEMGSSVTGVFRRVRRDHPAPFAAFLMRPGSTVISASPERFLRIELESGRIETSPIKGTRPRGKTSDGDESLRRELITSEKDIAENTMIVDLLRNDLGRICQYGSVHVERFCDLETHPTYFNLVSTITGQLRENTRPSETIRAMFPCGSITGAPKISTMRVIRDLEPSPRGLSMGAIGIYVPSKHDIPGFIDMSVAIRTLTVYKTRAVFNVGGGIVIDSDPASEFAETVTKSKAIVDACGG